MRRLHIGATRKPEPFERAWQRFRAVLGLAVLGSPSSVRRSRLAVFRTPLGR
jgi:hypothetical protein